MLFVFACSPPLVESRCCFIFVQLHMSFPYLPQQKISESHSHLYTSCVKCNQTTVYKCSECIMYHHAIGLHSPPWHLLAHIVAFRHTYSFVSRDKTLKYVQNEGCLLVESAEYTSNITAATSVICTHTR